MLSTNQTLLEPMGKKINESPFKKLQVPVVRVLKGFFNLKK